MADLQKVRGSLEQTERSEKESDDMTTAQARKFLRESNARNKRRLKRQQRVWTLSGDTRQQDGEIVIIDGYDTICTLWRNGLVPSKKRGQLICDAVNNFKLHRKALRLLRKVAREIGEREVAERPGLSPSTASRVEKFLEQISKSGNGLL